VNNKSHSNIVLIGSPDKKLKIFSVDKKLNINKA